MENPIYYVFLTLIVLILVFLNCLFSKDIYEWVPSIKNQIMLYLLVWLLPIIGCYLANKMGGLGWFAKRKSEIGNAVISSGFMEMDSVFNPGVKHTIELVEKQKYGMYQEKSQSDDKDKNT
ncbi:hypothetical protein [Oceanicoccus sagamiensis]|uniref:Uncharacterized protein n=1 Tax=Oceanicoccus sagamiensis TaxID=716816 RepID=A0A1X9NE11_9GAMM|nr:hypothetical protein [Oceanicoccus sagamiensis]ARN73779.1 hypothetical protein BST96_06420 [Oceanicoccus sagamiensis]